MIREAHALARELVEVRREDVLVPLAADRADGLVIGEQDDDVGLVCGGDANIQRQEK
jgi:hypothetical protein